MEKFWSVMVDVLAAVGLASLLWFLFSWVSAHGAEWCYASPRQFRSAHPGQHAYYRLIDGRKCWTSEQGRRSRLTWRTPSPQPRPAVSYFPSPTPQRVAPSRFDETFSALPSWDDWPQAKAFFSQELIVQAWRHWLAESMARAGRVRERWQPYGPPPWGER